MVRVLPVYCSWVGEEEGADLRLNLAGKKKKEKEDQIRKAHRAYRNCFKSLILSTGFCPHVISGALSLPHLKATTT